MTAQNKAEEIVKGLKDLQQRLSKIFEMAESEQDFDTAHERLRRWKERAVRFIRENVSDKEANILEQTELGSLIAGEVLHNLGREMSLYDGILRALVEEVEEDPSILAQANVSQQAQTTHSRVSGERAATRQYVFIVHGRNHTVRDKIDLYLTKDLRLHTQVMQAGPHLGRTLPEKFEEMANICQFAVFILTADDALIEESSGRRIKRARQNVILEIGYFWGALGRRGKIAFLVESDPEMELPSDIQGIGWIPITQDLAETKMQLHRELKVAGLVR